MVWFYERQGAALSVETFFDRATSAYVLTVNWPDKPQETHRTSSEAEYHDLVEALEQRLAQERWAKAKEPHVKRDGWRGP